MRKLLAVVISTLMLVGFSTLPASAEDRPLKDGWHWIMPDGSVVGEGPKPGYHNVCSIVPNHEERIYWGAYAPESGWKNVYDRSWKRINELREQFYNDNARLWGVQNLKADPELVVDCNKIPAGALVEVDHVRDDRTIPPGNPNDGTDGSLEKCYMDINTTTTVLVTPATPGRPGTPATPAVTKTETFVKTAAKSATKTINPTVGWFQVDTYYGKSAAQKKALPALAKAKTLAYRGDKVFWGASKYEFVLITSKDVKTYGSLAKAINAKTKKIANLGTTKGRVPTLTTAWLLGPGATPKAPWGRTGKVVQKTYRYVLAQPYVLGTPAQPATYGQRTVVISAAVPGVPAVPATPAVYDTVPFKQKIEVPCV